MTKRYWHDLVDGTLVENIPLAELTTDTATNITEDTATLGGSVDTLEGNINQLDFFFEYGEVGAGFPNSTTPSSTSAAPITYTTDISGLSQKTDYEFRAAGTVDGETFIGGTQTFTTQSAIPDSGVMRLTFDDADTESGTALDVWNDNNGTINGATTGVSGANQTYTTNEAYSFDGSDDYVDLGTTIVPDPTSDFTISVWIKTTDNSGEVIYGQRDINDGDDVLILLVDGGGFGVRDYDGTTRVVIGGSPSDGNWHHGVVVRSSGEYVVYLDGVEVVRDNAGNPLVNDNDNIGRRGGSGGSDDYFEGDIDDLRVYDKALTSTEVSNLYNTGSIFG